MDLDRVPLFEQLEPAQRVLIAGMGGGYDVFSGLPLFFNLRARGVSVYLANLSFTDLQGVEGCRISPTSIVITADTEGPSDYFPEKFLCQWFRSRDEEVPIVAFKRTGVRPLTEAYSAVRIFAASRQPLRSMLTDGFWFVWVLE
jgi:hypothetical protein